MADLLLELFSEEIPAHMQLDAVEHLRSALTADLGKAGLAVKNVKEFVTPRRLAVLITDLPSVQEDVTTELKGPKIGAPEQAIQGFLKKSGLPLDQLQQKDGIYVAVIHQKGKPTAEVLKPIIEDILAKFPWPKSMRWGTNDITWVRPLHSILCLFDGKIIPVKFGTITASNTTRGHRFLAPAEITISDVHDYEAALQKAYVIPDRDKRKTEIQTQANNAAHSKAVTIKKDDGLLEEVTGLVEWPVVLVGTIDDKFMDLPPEVLTTVMRKHQKYFALHPVGREASAQDLMGSRAGADAPHGISAHFLITANMETADKGKAIIAGNERVLRARFSDARFFWDHDRKKPLGEWAQGLKDVTFHAKLGTVADKVSRIEKLAVQLADPVKADKKLVQKAAQLCKADLVTGMVGEFAELQGIMGRYYALGQKEDFLVADAIRDHYKPQGPNDSVPHTSVAICVALADKIDTLVSMFAIGEKPTGSKDPFALRRAALGIIRTILENNIRLNLKPLFESAPVAAIALHKAHGKLAQKTEASLKENHKVGKYLTVNESATEELGSAVPANLSAMLYEFFADRLVVQMKDQGIRHDIIKAVVSSGDDDLVRIVARAKALQDFIGTDDGKNLLAAYKRAVNILNIEEKKDKKTYTGILPSQAKVRSIEEALNKATGAVESCIQEERFKDAMNILSTLRKPTDEFFENTLINDPDKTAREENLKILAHIRRNFNWIADFTVIEG